MHVPSLNKMVKLQECAEAKGSWDQTLTCQHPRISKDRSIISGVPQIDAQKDSRTLIHGGLVQ